MFIQEARISDNVQMTKDLETYDCLDCEYCNWLPGEEYQDEEAYQKDDAYYEDDAIWDEE